MTFEDLKKMLEASEKIGNIKPDDIVCITINNGIGWEVKPIRGIIAPAVVIKEDDEIKDEYQDCYPQICFAREKV